MKSLLILFLITYSVVVFVWNNVWFLLGCTLFNLILLICFKISFKKLLKNIYSILPFLIIVFLFNLIFDNVIVCLIIVWQIFIVTNFCFIFSSVVSPVKIAAGLSTLLVPLKIFKVDINKVSVMLVLTMNFIPIFRRQMQGMKNTFKARHAKITIKNMISMLAFMFTQFFVNLFKISNDLERTLFVRGLED